MTECTCNTYDDLLDRPSLNSRGHQTKKIIDTLTFLAAHSEKEHMLYKCSVCGQLWQRSLDWVRGNKAYIFKVPNITEVEWAAKPFVQPDELFNRVGRIQQYLERAFFEETPNKCRHESCSNQAIILSVFCAFHHMENIGLVSEMTDEYRWFEPYVKRNFEFGIEQLKTLPNYKSYFS